MDVNLKAQLVGEFRSCVGAVVIDQDAAIHRGGNLLDGLLQRLFGVVRRKDSYNLFVVDHWFKSKFCSVFPIIRRHLARKIAK
jgi:hypothetical protein